MSVFTPIRGSSALVWLHYPNCDPLGLVLLSRITGFRYKALFLRAILTYSPFLRCLMAISKYAFTAPDADVILVTNGAPNADDASAAGTSCTTEFHVHSCILSAASPFFHDLFTLPQPSETSEKKPRIPVSESASVLDTLLRYVYPVSNPVISSLHDLQAVLEAAAKYDLECAISVLRKILVSPLFLEMSPLRVYAIACRHDLEEEAKIAARYTLNTNLLDAPLSEDLRHINAYSYHQLLTLHRRRSQAAQALIKMTDQVRCMQCNGSPFNLDGAPKWWFVFEKTAKQELAVRPTTDVVFGMEFLFRAANKAGCPRCPESVLDSWKFLRDLKAAIDALPETI